MELSVILPAYNEADNIPEVIEKTTKALDARDSESEIILINDGSTDDTQKIAEEQVQKCGRLKVITHARNLGLTEALMTGFRRAEGDVIIFLCSDLQSDPQEDIPKLLAEIENGCDVVLGWRRDRKEAKVFVSKLYHLLSRLLFGATLHDMNWIKAFRREVVQSIKLRSDWHRYIAILAAAQGYRITEIKTNYYPRKHGKSKFGKRRIFAGFFDLIVVKFHTSFIERPMFFFGSLGLLLMFIGGAIGVYGVTRFVIEEWILGVPDPGYKPMAVTYAAFMSSILSGLFLFAFGLIAEFLVTIREDLRGIAERAEDERVKKWEDEKRGK